MEVIVTFLVHELHIGTSVLVRYWTIAILKCQLLLQVKA